MARSVPNKVPEGGWGWVVCLASFWTNGVVFGIINSFGVLYVTMLEMEGATAFKISWIGSVCAGLNFFMAPFASIITDRLGCRLTAVIGGAIALTGVIASSFVTRIEYMYITYSFVMGLGFAIAYQPSLYILGIYFQKNLGLVNGLVCFGSAIFTIVLPITVKALLSTYGLQVCLWFEASIIFVMLAGGLTYRPRPEVVQMLDLNDDYTSVSRQEDEEDKTGTKCSASCGKVIDLSIWRERNYRIWVIAVPVGMFGYFVPFFHLVKHVNDIIPEARAEILIMCLGATSGVGRLVAGFISDHPKINPIHIQQLGFLVIGVCTTLMPAIHSFVGLCVLVLVMGFFDGAFVAMMALIAFKLVGRERASQAIGCNLGLMSFPLVLGPPLAGMLYDKMGTYDIAFICSGIPPVICACILFLIRSEPEDETDIGDETEKNAIMISRETTPSMVAKEAEARSKNHEFGKGGARRKSDGDGGWRPEGGRYDDDGEHGRRRSYRGNGMSQTDTSIIMYTEPPHATGNHHSDDDYDYQDINRYRYVYTDGGKLGKGLDACLDECQPPYAQRSHLNGTGLAGVPNRHHQMQINGGIRTSDYHPNVPTAKTFLTDNETAV